MPKTHTYPMGLRLHRLFAAVLGGVLLALAFEPLNWWWLSFVAVAPLLTVLPPVSRLERFATGWLEMEKRPPGIRRTAF